MLYSVEG